jgi:hypothetical protein
VWNRKENLVRFVMKRKSIQKLRPQDKERISRNEKNLESPGFFLA